MSHRITAVIGGQEPIFRLAERLGGSVPSTALDAGLRIVPLGDAQIDMLTQLAPGAYRDGFSYLSAGLERALLDGAGQGMLAYVETDYFGGRGVQAAAVFHDSEVAMCASQCGSPVQRDEQFPINRALRMLGIAAAPGKDEFDTIGLGRYRNCEDLGLMDE